MYKYVIFWVLITTVRIPCPDANKTDEFGRRSFYGCLVNHCRIQIDTLSKYFDQRMEAIEFYNMVLKEGFNASFDSILLYRDSLVNYNLPPKLYNHSFFNNVKPDILIEHPDSVIASNPFYSYKKMGLHRLHPPVNIEIWSDSDTINKHFHIQK